MYSETNFKFVENISFGGFITYWKLYFSTIYFTFKNTVFTKMQKAEVINDLISLKLFWWLFIKPLGFVFSKRISYVGKKISKNNNISFSGTKSFVLFIFRIVPIFYFRKSFSEKDISILESKIS